MTPNRIIRILTLASTAIAGVTCAENSVTGARSGGRAQLAINPVFSEAPEGGPRIGISRVRGVLRRAGSTDSVTADATVAGDSAILEFSNVSVAGDSTTYNLGVKAFDPGNVLIFEANEQVKVKPGENTPASPALSYVAPDAVVETINLSDESVELAWAGAEPNNTSCLNRAPSETAVTQKQLSVSGKTATGEPVSGVRVGWTSRDTSVATVSAEGLVKSRCSNKSTWIVARTFLDKADSIPVKVTAPPFMLLMSPDSVNVARGDTVRFTALVVDENNNAVAAAGVNWHTSDATRAEVNANGTVRALSNGRVLITASSGDRTTVGVVHVVRPKASSVTVIPQHDTAAAGQVRTFVARALDAHNRVIADASGFEWISSNSAVASVNQSGHVTAKSNGTATISAKLDGKMGSGSIEVMPIDPGSVSSTVVDAGNCFENRCAGLAGAVVTGPTGSVQAEQDGSFVLGGLKAGDDITVARDGYVGVTIYSVPVFPNQTFQIPAIPMAPVSATTGAMTGTVLNALTQGAVSGATVKVFSGLNAGPSPQRPDPTVLRTVTTASNGTFSITDIAAGTYTFIVSATGYSETPSVGISIGGTNTEHPSIFLPPFVASGGLFVVLTWDDCNNVNVPCDLDAHLTGPRVSPETDRFHVYYADPLYMVGNDTIAGLDVDVTSGRGPEVVGVRAGAATGTYRYYVHNFTNALEPDSRALSDSSFARVDVYQDGRIVGSFFPPAGKVGTLWKVFEFDGARVTPLGEITHLENTDELPVGFRRAGASGANDDAARLLNDVRGSSKVRR